MAKGKAEAEDKSKEKDKAAGAAKVADKLPEQKPGDTPVAPWNMPKPEQKEAAKPVKEALTKAVAEVDSPEKAEQVAETLQAALGDQTTENVVGKTKESAASGAQMVKEAGEAAPKEDEPGAVLAETARVVEAAKGKDKEA